MASVNYISICHGSFLNCVTYHDLYWGHWWETMPWMPFSDPNWFPVVTHLEPKSWYHQSTGKLPWDHLHLIFLLSEHWFEGVPGSLYNLSKSVPDLFSFFIIWKWCPWFFRDVSFIFWHFDQILDIPKKAYCLHERPQNLKFTKKKKYWLMVKRMLPSKIFHRDRNSKKWK